MPCVRRLLGLFTAPTLMCAAYGLLLLSWAMSNAPFAGADETSHYVRAIAVGNGQLVGPLDPYTTADFPNSPITLAWLNDATRAVTVPGDKLSRTATCNTFHARESAACLEDDLRPITGPTVLQNPVGNYQPLPYVLPGLAIDRVDGPFTAALVGRLVSAFVCWLFLCLAVRLAWNREAPSLIGTALAVTPMVLFTASIINPSGLEIATGLAFAAAVLRLRRHARPPAWVWTATAVSGLALSLSRSPGPVWMVMDLVVLVLLLGGRETRHRLRAQPIAAATTMLVLVLGIAVNRVWEGLYGSHLRLTLAEVQALGPPSNTLVDFLFSQQIGNFGWTETPMSPTLIRLWFALIILLLAIALVVGTARERAVLLLAVAGCFLVTIGLPVVFQAGTGFSAQGRHLLPVTVMLPLLAGHILTEHRTSLPSPSWAGARGEGRSVVGVLATVAALLVAALVAALQVGGWYTNSRRNAVGAAGPRWFFAQPQWQPPLGWYPWLAITLVAAALTVVALCLPGGLLPVRPIRPAPPTPSPVSTDIPDPAEDDRRRPAVSGR